MDKQKMFSLIRQAIEDYNLIEEGDKIAIGVSGGKDSLSLLVLLSELQKFYPKHFDLMAITCDVGFPGMDFSEVERLCYHSGIPYEIVHTQIADIVFKNNADKRPCSLCARLRKGALYTKLSELGFHKIAYAHNKDDFIETALLSLLFEGRFYSFPPLTELDNSKVCVIRPMMYIPEKSVASFAKTEALPIVQNKCPVDGSTKRAYAKDLLARINKENPGAKNRIFHAILAQDFSDWPMRTTPL